MEHNYRGESLATEPRVPGNGDGHYRGAECACSRAGAPSCDARAALESDLAFIKDAMGQVLAAIKELQVEKQVLDQLHDQVRLLTARFYEQEFLRPMFLALIGIADRCRQEITRLKKAMHGFGADGEVEIALAARSVIQARKADLTEIENLLANNGVESFTCPGDQFNPSLQKYVRRETCADTGRNNCVAQRCLPGYRRNGQVLRPEYVTVFIGNPQTERSGT